MRFQFTSETGKPILVLILDEDHSDGDATRFMIEFLAEGLLITFRDKPISARTHDFIRLSANRAKSIDYLLLQGAVQLP